MYQNGEAADMRTKPIPDEREEDLIIRAQAGSAFSMNELTQRYLPLIRSLANRLMYSGSAPEELIQAGYVGLLSAIKRYDERKKTRLSTYAVPWILGEMKAELRKRYDSSTWASLDADIPHQECTLQELLAGKEENGVDAINLRLAVARLTSEEQMVICLRYYRDKTQSETAVLLRKSQAQVSRIERAALDRLKEYLL